MNAFSRSSRLLALLAGIVALGTASLANATPSFDGDHSGHFVAKTDSPFVVGGGQKPSSVTFTTLRNGTVKLVIQGTDYNKKPFTANFTLYASGKAHTDTIMPGIAVKKGDGTWSISGNKRLISMQLHSTEQATIGLVIFHKGNVTTQTTIQLKGPHDKFLIRGNIFGTSNVGRVTGHYKFR